jgi:hypothetical protein
VLQRSGCLLHNNDQLQTPRKDGMVVGPGHVSGCRNQSQVCEIDSKPVSGPRWPAAGARHHRMARTWRGAAVSWLRPSAAGLRLSEGSSADIGHWRHGLLLILRLCAA